MIGGAEIGGFEVGGISLDDKTLFMGLSVARAKAFGMETIATGTATITIGVSRAQAKAFGFETDWLVEGIPEVDLKRPTFDTVEIEVLNMGNSDVRIARKNQTKGKFADLIDISTATHSDTGLTEIWNYAYVFRFVVTGTRDGLAYEVAGASGRQIHTTGKNQIL